MRSRLVMVAFLALALAGTLEAKDKKKSVHKASTETRQSSGGPMNTVHLKLSAPLNVPSGYSITISGALGYERSLSLRNSVAFDLAYQSIATDYSAISLGAGYRWWIGELPGRLQGFFAGPRLYMTSFNYPSYTYNTSTFALDRTNNSTIFFGGGGEGGYQWIFPNGLMTNLGGELVLPFGTYAGYGFALIAKGAVGFAF